MVTSETARPAREAPVSDPQLRCLLCDLILADPSTAGRPTETCRQAGCGREILAGQTAADGPIELTAPVRPAPATGAPLTPVFEDDDLPVADVVSKPAVDKPAVPTVQPRSRPADPPVVGKRPAAESGGQRPPRPLPLPPPRRVTLPEPPRRLSSPRPQIATALGVLGCMTVLIILCLSVVGYAILYGLKRASKKAEAPVRVTASYILAGGA